MSSKKAKINPKAAFSSTLTADDKKHYERCLVQSQDGTWYLFPTKEVGSIAIMRPRSVYGNWKEFCQDMKVTLDSPGDADMQSLTKLYALGHGEEPSKESLKDPMELSIMVWMRLCKTAANRLNSAPDPTLVNPATGKVKRSFKKLQDRGYEVIKLEVDPALKLPPQAKTCIEFFAEMVKERNPNGEDTIITIPEKDVQAYVVKEQARLQTRQDPWRIFQYYRPQLIKNGNIRLV
jgi:hypothetical protein